ncbi:MAG: lysophospholipid acyltransferase family protein, partial [Sciscionella sp.]
MTGPAQALPERSSPRMHRLGRVISSRFVRPFVRLRVTGLERVPAEGPLVVIANHSSLLEPALLFGLLPRWLVFLAKQELFVPPLGSALRSMG